ncbi:MAG: protein TolQ [Gammaproteobacteria bacterium]|nr:protein TolQ [Gammaproteobacteria bacterium]
MNADFSLLSLFTDATWVVKLIMLTLVGVSVVSWTFIIQRTRYYNALEQLESKFEHEFSTSQDLVELYRSVSYNKDSVFGLLQIFKSGLQEYFVNKKYGRMDPDTMLENSKRAMEAAIREEIDNLEKNLSFLATVGSVSPYIGLFGTVWGIMHSFIALGSVQQATLSMVAPGIAEALIATAMGLFAAIPAFIAYNRCATRVNEMVNKYERFQISFTNSIARQIYT